MRVTIVSRIFAPEISAAAGLLSSWAREFRDQGHQVTVVTTRPPRGIAISDPDGIRVRRAPVLRDRQHYVRGYLSYLSFDIPLAFRLLFSRKADLYIVEPPPTTTAVVRVIAALRRTPYIVDAADLWSDAAVMATKSRLVLRSLRWVERFALNGAAWLLVVAQGYADRMREIGITTPTTTIGFGADTDLFHYRHAPIPNPPCFIYAGTYSEWHGAEIFIDAFASLLRRVPGARLRFIGNGQERDALTARALSLGIADSVEVLPPIPPQDLAPELQEATISLSSLKPGQGYDYAFTTKIFSSLAAGCPIIFTGVGPTVKFLQEASNRDAGVAVPYDVGTVADAMLQAAQAPLAPESRRLLSEWVVSKYSLSAIAKLVVRTSLEAIGR